MGVPAHNKGIPNSEATRLKISIANTGKTQSRETIERRIKSKLLRGTGKHTEESKKKISQGRIGSNNPFFGKKHSEESRKKISENLLGDKNPFFGKTHSDEFRKNSSAIHKGKSISQETRNKLSKALKGKKQSSNHVMKRISARLATLKNNKMAC